MEISTLRWTIASFCAGVAALGLLSIPLLAVSVGVGSAAFRDAAVFGVALSLACALVIAVALDLLGARARAMATRRGAAPRPRERRRGARPASAS